jgi:hypothetical protein
MTPEDERELFRRLARIDRRLQMLGGWGIGMLALYLADRVYEGSKADWGAAMATLLAVFAAIAVGWFFVHHFDRD